MKIKSDPKTMDHVIRMEMAKQEHDASIRRAREEGRDEERKKAFLEKIESAKAMLRDNMPIDLIARYLGLSPSEVRTLQ